MSPSRIVSVMKNQIADGCDERLFYQNMLNLLGYTVQGEVGQLNTISLFY